MPPKSSRPKSPQAPASLIDIQAWMTEAICTPSEEQDSALQHQAKHRLTPSKYLSPEERLDIYVNDFWPRCIDSLAEDFPGLQALLGEDRFEEWMTRYVQAFPSESYTLYHLGQHMVTFFETTYQEADRALILDDVRYEWALTAAYFREEKEPFNPEKLTDKQKVKLADLPLSFQPYVHLLSLQYELRPWVARSTKRSGKPKKKDNYVIVFRLNHEIKDRALDHSFFTLLSELQSGQTLNQALDRVSENLTEKELKLLEKKVAHWFESCVRFGWLCHPEKKA